jgi:hypothetical protein
MLGRRYRQVQVLTGVYATRAKRYTPPPEALGETMEGIEKIRLLRRRCNLSAISSSNGCYWRRLRQRVWPVDAGCER